MVRERRALRGAMLERLEKPDPLADWPADFAEDLIVTWSRGMPCGAHRTRSRATRAAEAYKGPGSARTEPGDLI
jgi:hypothetical protein